MVYKLINKVLGDPNEKAIKKIQPLVEKINAQYQQYKRDDALTLAKVPEKTQELKERVQKGETLDALLPEAFALVKYTAELIKGRQWKIRDNDFTWDMVHYDVQLIGGIVLHQGKIAEMKTGEGKTLVSTLPVYLSALSGKGVHLVTVNEYLASRDAEWMGGLFDALGLSVGVIAHGQSSEEKRAAYACDITYGTNNEFGFDYLRDNMAIRKENKVQRELNYAIVDEVDSILIDEARTPLIISAPAEESTSKYQRYARLVGDLKEHDDYIIDEKMKTATLTEDGIKNMEQKLGVDNIYTDAGFMEVHHLEQALKALTVYKKDVDYMIKDDEILIVDEFTGRLMPGRRYSDGLHQAIEAKEGVEIKRESKTLATITFQNYFRIYNKLAGMTGTAMTEAEEFLQIYGLDPIAIPTNKPIARDDRPDMVFKNQKGKYVAIAKRVKESYEKGQPVLIGTISIEKSEIMSRMLELEKVPHSVLNAKHHEKEAEIVAKAGQKNAVTIATNMAGRGTDIKLGEGVYDVGGLLVIGTERHESRRIDNQLRGRGGRQGDPGETQFFVSMEDDLMRLFVADKMKNMMEALKVPDDMPIQNRLISNSIESAQKKVEGRNFDIRKHLVEYDNVMNKHREIIYSRRGKVLDSENMKNDIILLIEKEVEKLVLFKTSDKDHDEPWDLSGLMEDIEALHKSKDEPLSQEDYRTAQGREALIDLVKTHLLKEYDKKESQLASPETMRQVERNVYLSVIDTLWMEHIDGMQQLRESVALRGYAQRDPLVEYKEEAYIMFSKLLDAIRTNTVTTLFKVDLEKQLPPHLLRGFEADNLITNDDQIEGNITHSTISGAPAAAGAAPTPSAPRVIRVGSENSSAPFGSAAANNRSSSTNPSNSQIISAQPNLTAGRNDPCPCGSGKKYKKCHGLS